MTCPGCGNALRDDARFCGVCGASTASGGGTQLTAAPAAVGLIGRDIAGRYRILAKLGEGGMGAVYRAEQISLKRQVAVKVLRPEVLGNELLLRRFNAEAEAVAKLSHPSTVNIYDFGQDRDGALFIAMEYIEGESLRSVLQREPLSPRRALAIAHQVAASLADAHRHGVIHRDLKPDNVMLQDRGRELDVARVLDFGIAKLRDETRATQMQMTQQGDVVGTPQYMAPEQIRGERVDGRTDIYALGCMLYEMLTGRRPYEAPSVLAMLSKHLIEQAVPPSRLRPELPPQVDALIMATMAKDPAARPASMDDVGEQLAQLLASAPPDPRAHRASASASSYPGSPASLAGSATQGGHVAPAAPTPVVPSMVARGAAPPRSRRGPVIAVAALLVAAGAGTAIYLAVAGHDEPAPPVAIAPPPAPPARDPWQTESSISGNKAGIGQGVSLIIPPSYTQTGTKGALTYAVDPLHNRAIFAGPIEPATNDLDELARYHARVNHLTLRGGRVQITVGGVGRSLLYFDGVLPNKLAIRQVVLPLIGPGYRVVVIFQALQDQLDHDQATQLEALNVFTQRVVLP